MACASDGTDVPVSPLPASSSNVGSPNGSLPDLEGTGIRAGTMEDKINEMFIQIAMLSLLMQSLFRFAASGSASSWNLHGHSDGSTATGPLGPMAPGSSGNSRSTRRRLDTFSRPEDEHARSAVLLQFPCEQYHAGVSAWFETFWATTNGSFSLSEYPSTGNLSSQFFLFGEEGLISVCSYSFWRRKEFFLTVEGLQFLTQVNFFLKF